MASQNMTILLADDDLDDCLFFRDALEELAIEASLITVHDGEQLMQHLKTVSEIPHTLFLDLNMPRKAGAECLTEIKNHSTLNSLPVIIISTSYDEERVKQLYHSGANYYITKPSSFNELKNVIKKALTLLSENSLPATVDDFVINKPKTAF